MKLTLLSKSYVISMTIRQFMKLEGADLERYDQVRKWLSQLGCEIDQIEYNGHFGPNFFFRLASESESQMDSCAQKVLKILSSKLR